MTPGVYIEEKDSFPGSIVAVETAVPAFIGYTEMASRKGRSLLNQAVRITSLAEYVELFGGAFMPKFTLDAPAANNTKPEIMVNGSPKVINYMADNKAFMFPNIKLFFANGGGACYIVSVGTYKDKDKVVIDKDELLGTKEVGEGADKKIIEGGLKMLLKEQEPTMVLMPDAVNLPGNGCYEVYVEVLKHCAKMQSRVAILDIKDGYEYRIRGDKNVDIITNFRESIGSENLSYAAAYYPWLQTSIVPKKEVKFDCLSMTKEEFEKMFTEDKAIEFFGGIKAKTAEPETGTEPADTPADPPADPPANDDGDTPQPEGATAKSVDLSKFEISADSYHLGLLATSPTYADLIDELWSTMNLLPASSAMAGLYTAVDNSRGVWKSPANVSVSNVIKPAVNITHDEQENLNVDAISGKSVNAIRTFPGVGTLVWGGRTLDGNSLDWRYINVRRTMIMLEQSIKLALRAYVFEPNDANTWVTVKSMIINFLTEKWKQGALAGTSPEDAFEVNVGLGSTMTSLDILEGKMLVSVKLAIVRPAEFIVVTFEQQMQKS